MARTTTNNNLLFFKTEHDLKKVREMAEMHCTMQEIADVFGCSRQALYDREDVLAIIKEAKAAKKFSLRKAMFMRAVYDGDDQTRLAISQKALEHCHKWYLDQRDQATQAQEEKPSTFLPPVAALDDHCQTSDDDTDKTA